MITLNTLELPESMPAQEWPAGASAIKLPDNRLAKETDTVVSQPYKVVQNMRIAFWLNFSFSCIEFVGGFLTNSVTVLSDAVHDLGDSIAIGLSLILEKKSRKGRTPVFTYGQRRFSILAAFITSLVLIIGAVFIVIEAIRRFWHIEAVQAQGVFWLAVLGIAFNGFAVLRLQKGSKESLNQRGMMLHLLEDTLGWAAVLVGAVVMYFTSWYWIDPLLSLGIAGLILWNAVKNLWSAFRIFLQAVPEGYDEHQLTGTLKTLPEIADVRNLQCWTIDGAQHVLTVQLVLREYYPAQRCMRLKDEVRCILHQHNIQFTTIELEMPEV